MLVPLSAAQVEAAVELRLKHMPLLAAADEALTNLAAKEVGLCISLLSLPASHLPAAIIRAAAVNQLYTARVPWNNLLNMAKYISERWHGSLPASPDTVEAIAKNSGGDAYRAFASKFVYFFGDTPFAVPIWDSRTKSRLQYHLGSASGGYQTYINFYEDARTLKKSVISSWSFRDLDRYLWLSAHYGSPDLAGELADVFAPDASAEIIGLVTKMMGMS